MLSGWSLISAQILAHTGFFYLVATGNALEWLTALFVYFLNGCIGMTATYHRLLSHRSWKAPKWVEYFGVLCATIGMTGSAISWVAIHRKHHRFTDNDKDPHSPHFKGFVYCQWLSMFEKVEVRYVADLARERFYSFQHRHYFSINLIWAAIVFLLDPRAVFYAWLAPACILWNAGSAVVTFNHMFGANPHGLKNQARNLLPLGYLVWGEGWHNNHHNSPESANFSEKAWQLDVGYWYIWTIQKLNDLWKVHFKSQTTIIKSDHHVGVE